MPDRPDQRALPELEVGDARPPGTWRVSELTTAIGEALDAWFGGELWVEGEIASLRRSAPGHVYFQLVEPGPPGGQPVASVSVALFAAARAHVNRVLRSAGGVRMTDGMKIRIRGRLDVYAPAGTVQLRMSGIDPTYTLGLLASQRDALVQALGAEGVLGANASLPLSLVPLHVAVVAAPDSAALADVVHELAASGFGWRVRVLATPVQGAGADRALAASLTRAETLGVDAVLLVRGGGARTDLATFDSEVLARTVCGLSVPVVSGIGHETDTSVADLVAHLACKTPTAAAAALCQRVRAYVARVDESSARLAGAATRTLAGHERRLERSRKAGAAGARHALRRAEHRLDRDAGRVEGAARSHLRAADTELVHLAGGLADVGRRGLAASVRRLDHAEARRALLDPARTLARGWSITTTTDGRVVRSVDDVADDDEVETRVADGSITSVVSRRRPPASPAPVPPAPA